MLISIACLVFECTLNWNSFIPWCLGFGSVFVIAFDPVLWHACALRWPDLESRPIASRETDLCKSHCIYIIKATAPP